MRMKHVAWDSLHAREDRLTARIAAIARADTITGGARASWLAEKLLKIGGTDLRGVVADVYCASTGRASTEHEAWQCPECGQPHLGQTRAFECCAECFEPQED